MVMSRKTRKPADMSALLQSSTGTLAQIATKTNSLTLLADIVRQICPDLPEDAWHIANFKQNSLVIEVKSSAWGQRLQFERTKICQELSNVTQGAISQIELKISPYRNKQEKLSQASQKKTQFISDKTAEQLREVAANAPVPLRKKLEKLAAHANKTVK